MAKATGGKSVSGAAGTKVKAGDGAKTTKGMSKDSVPPPSGTKKK